MSSNQEPEILFVAGTDTGIGKTVLSLLLMQFFFAKGLKPFYLKPVQTGCRDPYDTDSDARFVYKHVEALRSRDPAESVIYCFREPKAPYFAARNEGGTIDPRVIGKVVEEKRLDHSPLVLEAAGGILVPMTSTQHGIDLAAETGARPVLAARSALGTINHTLLTLEALRARNLEPLGIVFIDPFDPCTPRDLVEENMEAVRDFGGIRVAGVIPRIPDFSNPPGECFEILRRMFARERFSPCSPTRPSL